MNEVLECKWFVFVIVGLFLRIGRIFIDFGSDFVKNFGLFFCLVNEGIWGKFIVDWLRVDGWVVNVCDWFIVFLECWLFVFSDFIILLFLCK